VIFGLGGYIKGLDAFATYEARSRDFRMAVSFAPENARDLLEVGEITLASPALYPYRLHHNEPAWLARVELANKTAKPVEVSLKLRGPELPTIKQGFTLASSSRSSVEIPLPRALAKLAPGVYEYHVEVVAFQRGRQNLQRQFSFEMKDAHDWSGASSDLFHFIQPHEPQIVQTARAVLAEVNATRNAVSIAECFYNFLHRNFRYVSDPRPLHSREDRVQYANETLRLQSGDCEDLTILMVSLLQSAGVHSAFVEIAPQGSAPGHVLLMFDSQQNPAAASDTDNLQRYIVRQNGEQPGRLFVPLELTRLDLPFAAAWQEALALYQKFGMEQYGLAEGWVKIIDTARVQD
ncbi:transglutaminase domain-containing protein, partial [candidate division KSB1 bacterium]|nr:transglutaminase domain-containing protein [candidate division KSB1 bacterium]